MRRDSVPEWIEGATNLSRFIKDRTFVNIHFLKVAKATAQNLELAPFLLSLTIR
jgi:hypothetical protein